MGKLRRAGNHPESRGGASALLARCIRDYELDQVAYYFRKEPICKVIGLVEEGTVTIIHSGYPLIGMLERTYVMP